ncbi:unnamed protein product [Lymnaea stagnalis]|uniref:Uncharacterized protein n=1 Tax=Lymnaea stagnalis TaxID=6523 RepID=A0AAV2I9S8_LYMST
MNFFDDFIIERLWELHKSPRSQVGTLLASPRYQLPLPAMIGGQRVPKDFRLKGYTSQAMVSPRQPVVAPAPNDRKRNEEKLFRLFGKASIFEPPKGSQEDDRSSVISDGWNRGPLPLRPLQDPFINKSEEEIERIKKERMDMEEDIQRLKEKQMREKMEREQEKRQNYELLSSKFPWDQKSHGHGGPMQRKENDLFSDRIGGPGGAPLRQNGTPALSDPRFFQQQQQDQYRSQQTPHQRPGSMTPFELQEYSRKLKQVSEEKRVLQQQRQIEDLKYQIETYKNDPSQENGHHPMDDFFHNGYQDEQRSLDLENTRGGAGAPVKDIRGRSLTRRPITLSRDDYGESRVREEIPGKQNSDSADDDNKPYFPWGGQGGGAPIRDRDGKVITQVFGKLEGKDAKDDVRRNRLRQEVLYNDLKEVAKQQKENKEELDRYIKAPQVEMAEMILAGRVGKPKRDDLTGEIAQQHLGHSDVSKVKSNYQPKPVTEKKMYHDELVRMAEERQYQKQLEKFKERQESNAHFQNMDSTWGAYGGGAPKHQVVRKKVNLTNALYYRDQAPHSDRLYSASTPANPTHAPSNPTYNRSSNSPTGLPTGLGSFEYQQSPMSAAYQKVYVEDDARQFQSPDNSPRYIKSTINSSHRNLYQTQVDQRLQRGGQPLAPYATGIQ